MSHRTIMIPRTRVATVINATGNQFFNVTFIKKNGQVRSLNGRLGVTKGVSGVRPVSSLSQYVSVWDRVKKGYRKVNLDTVSSIMFGGDNYIVS